MNFTNKNGCVLVSRNFDRFIFTGFYHKLYKCVQIKSRILDGQVEGASVVLYMRLSRQF